MLTYIFKRILMIIPVMIGVVTLVFTIIWFAPGDAVDTMADMMTTEAEKEEMRHELGLDRPFLVQLGEYLFNVVTKLDLGTALINKTNVGEDLAARFPNSLKLALTSIIFAIVTGIPLGLWAALKQNKAGDAVAMVIALLGVSTPGFWLALMLVLLFSYYAGWLPPYGLGGWEYWVMPVVATGLHGTARLARQTRSSMLEVIRSDYVTMAKAKGLSYWKVVLRHALPNAMLPLITVAGMSFGVVLGGGLIIERVFTIPGIGAYLVDAVNSRDHIAVMGGVILVSACFSLIMLGCDLLMGVVDPRIKARYAGKRRRKKNV